MITSSLKLMWLVKEHLFANKKLRNSRGKNIRNLKLSIDVGDWYNMVIINLTKRVTIYLNILGLLMKNWICNNLNNSCLIRIKRHCISTGQVVDMIWNFDSVDDLEILVWDQWGAKKMYQSVINHRVSGHLSHLASL